MSLTAADQKRIVEQETAWVDSAFAGLDLSAFPALNELPAEDKHDDRWARDWRDTALSASAAELRKFVSDPDVETLSRVADETNNPGLLRDVRDRRGERVAAEFKARCPGYLPTDSNYNAMVTTLAYNSLSVSEQNLDTQDVVDLLIERGYWTSANLEAVYVALDREGILDRPAGEPRNLSERERLRVSRLAQSGQIDQAIAEYLSCALDGDEPDLELINDPAYRQLCDDAVWSVFSESQLDFVETASRRAYLLRFAGGRPLTITLLQKAWESCQSKEKQRERGELLDSYQRPQETPVNEKQLDELSDQAVDDLYHRSLRHYAQQSKRSSGVLA
jgi:hypothetical protein